MEFPKVRLPDQDTITCTQPVVDLTRIMTSKAQVTPPRIGKMRTVVHYTLTGPDPDTACSTAVGYPWMLLACAVTSGASPVEMA